MRSLLVLGVVSALVSVPLVAAAQRPPQEPQPQQEPSKAEPETESRKAVYFSGDVAFTRSDLGALVDKTGFDKTSANGVLYGLGAGLRLQNLRIGLRWRIYDTTEFSLWSFALSAGIGLRMRPIEPILSAHVGYVFDQHTEQALVRSSLPAGAVLPPDVEMKGLLFGVDVNASYWVTRFLRLGAFVGADLMLFSRERATIPRSLFGNTPELESNPLYSGAGSGLGLNLNAGFRGAFDIGFD